MDGKVCRVWYRRLPDGSVSVAISFAQTFECMASWDVRLMAWEVEEGQSGRRVVWMERETLGAKPCDLTVGYLHGLAVTYDPIPASSILPPPPDPTQPWQEEYRTELLEHASLFSALDDGLGRLYRRARLSEQEIVALDGWLHGLPRELIAAQAHCRWGRVPELVESALTAIRQAFRIREGSVRVMGDGTLQSDGAGGPRLLPGPDLPRQAAVAS